MPGVGRADFLAGLLGSRGFDLVGHQVEEVVGTNEEDLRQRLHAQSVALAEGEIDLDLHRTGPSTVGQELDRVEVATRHQLHVGVHNDPAQEGRFEANPPGTDAREVKNRHSTSRSMCSRPFGRLASGAAEIAAR